MESQEQFTISREEIMEALDALKKSGVVVPVVDRQGNVKTDDKGNVFYVLAEHVN